MLRQLCKNVDGLFQNFRTAKDTLHQDCQLQYVQKIVYMVHSHQVREQGGGGVTDTISLEVQHECLKTKHSFIVG